MDTSVSHKLPVKAMILIAINANNFDLPMNFRAYSLVSEIHMTIPAYAYRTFKDSLLSIEFIVCYNVLRMN